MPDARQSDPNGAQSGAQPGVFVDPYRAYNFKLSISNMGEGYFTECSGLEVRVHAIKYRTAGQQQVVLPGQVEYGDVTLRYGLTDSPELWQWFMSAVSGNVDRRHVSIAMYASGGGAERIRWDLNDAWPAAWRGAILDTLTNEAAIESLTLVFNSLTRQDQQQ
jgi:phage tail-like protein